MMYKLLSVTIAVSADEIIQAGKSVGTASNQVILGVLVVSLTLLVAYREWQQVKANKAATARHEQTLSTSDKRHEDLVTRLDRERSAWDEERRSRIAMLMTLVQDNTKAMERAAMAQTAVAEAVGINTAAMSAFRDLIFQWQGERESKKR